MEFARCDGTDIPAFVRGNEDGRGERSRGEDIHDKIMGYRPVRIYDVLAGLSAKITIFVEHHWIVILWKI